MLIPCPAAKALVFMGAVTPTMTAVAGWELELAARLGIAIEVQGAAERTGQLADKYLGVATHVSAPPRHRRLPHVHPQLSALLPRPIRQMR